MKESGQGEGETIRKKKGVKSSHQKDQSIQLLDMTMPLLCAPLPPSNLCIHHIYELFRRILSRARWECYCLKPRGGSVTKHLFSFGHLILHVCVSCVCGATIYVYAFITALQKDKCIYAYCKYSLGIVV